MEGDPRQEFVRNGKMCNMRFFDAEPLASVSVIVDEGYIVVLGPQESYIENTSTGQRILMIREKGVLWCTWTHKRVRERRNM